MTNQRFESMIRDERKDPVRRLAEAGAQQSRPGFWNGRVATGIQDRYPELLGSIIDSSRNAIAVLDREMAIILLNQRCQKDLDIKPPCLQGRNIRQACPGFPQKWLEALARALKGEFSAQEDDLYTRGDGRRFWVSWDCRPWCEVDGTTGGVIFQADFAVERHRADRLLRENEAQLKAIFEQLPQGMALVDAVTGRVCQVNSKFIEIFGNCGQLDLVRLKRSDLLDQHRDALARLESGQSDAVNIDKSYIQCDGSIFRIHIRITRYASPAQPNPCLLWMVEDTSLNGQ